MRSWLAIALLAPCGVFAQDSIVHLRVDATDAPRRLLHVRMSMPVKAGPMTLLYPEWIPGEHGPTGPIADLVGLKLEANGQPIPWKRDSVNMFAFHITVQPGVATIDLAFDFISPPETAGLSSGGSATTELAVLNWNQLLLYPEGVPADRLQYQADLKVPQNWRFGTALPI